MHCTASSKLNYSPVLAHFRNFGGQNIKLPSHLSQRRINIRRETQWMRQWDFPLTQSLGWCKYFQLRSVVEREQKLGRMGLPGVGKGNSQHISFPRKLSLLHPLSQQSPLSCPRTRCSQNMGEILKHSLWVLAGHIHQWVGLLCYTCSPWLPGSPLQVFPPLALMGKLRQGTLTATDWAIQFSSSLSFTFMLHLAARNCDSVDNRC